MLRAWERYQNQRGDHYAAGITYFTVLALFPLLMVGFAVAGFVLAGNPELLTEAQDKIVENAPGNMGDQLNDIIDQAIAARATVGVLGLLVALYAGLGWVNNLRAALTEQWDQQHEQGNWIRTKISDLGALIGLGIALIVSFGVAAVGSGSLLRQVLEWLNLEDAPGVGVTFRVLSIVVGIMASWAVMVWVIARLPREPVTFRSAARAALIAAVGFEVFKQFGVIYLNIVLRGPAGIAFGPIIGIMVFAYFTSRIILFATAWAATAQENLAMAPVPPPSGAVISPRLAVRGGPSVAGGVALVGAGALAALGLSGLRRKK